MIALGCEIIFVLDGDEVKGIEVVSVLLLVYLKAYCESLRGEFRLES